jgi:DNA-binding PadR family transcriptional regulator
MAQLSELELLALAAIARIGEDAYGVSIREEIERRTGRAVSIGSLYKALHRLERQGLTLVAVGEPTPVRGGRAKKYIGLEPAGRAALESSVESLRRLVDGVGRSWSTT